jgi:glutamate-1-semialdehyde 2,1-aminomutase
MYSKSKKQYKESQKYLAGGVSSHFRMIFHPVPLTYKFAKGSKLTDIDGNTYIDYALAAGPIVLGHAPKEVLTAVKNSLNKGQLYYGQHETEIKLAKKIIEIIPSAERVRFASSGSEAVHAAIRLSRGYTNKKLILKFHGQYHGWYDSQMIGINPLNKNNKIYNSYGTNMESMGQIASSAEDIISIPWNDITAFKKTIKKYKKKFAAVIMEPIMCNTCVILPKNQYLEEIRKICTKNKIVLIFDEVITGFRIKLGGAQEHLNVIPDLSIFAKGIASGFSLSCLVGKKEIMDFLTLNKVIHGGTYNSSVINTVAALKTIEIIERQNKKFFKKLNEIRIKLTSDFYKIAKEKNIEINIQGVGSIFHISFTNKNILHNHQDYLTTDLNISQKFIRKMQDNKIRITGRGTWFISYAHTKTDIKNTIKSFTKSLDQLNYEN